MNREYTCAAVGAATGYNEAVAPSQGPSATQKCIEIKECPALRVVQYELDRTEILHAPHLSQTMEAADVYVPGSQASQEVASEVEERPAMQVVQCALAERRIYLRSSWSR